MITKKVAASIDVDTLADLEYVASKTPFKTANQLLAAAGAELAKLKKEDGSIYNIYHALSRIADVSPDEDRKAIRGQAALPVAR